MAKSAVINFQILGDSKSGEQALNRTTAAAAKVEPSAKVAGDALGDVKNKLLNMVPGGQQAVGILSKVGAASGETGSMLSGALVGGAAAGAVAIAGLAEQGVTKFAALTGEITKFKNVSGASAEEASKFVAVAKGYGVDVDAMGAAVFRMGATVATQPKKFQDLGVEIAHNKDGTVDLVGTLENASKAYMATTDATTKDAIAKQIGGKAGAQLIPILKGGSAAIKEFGDAAKNRGMVFSDKDLAQGVEFRKSMRELGQSVEGLEIQLGKGLVPAISQTTEQMSGAIDWVNKLTAPIGGLSGIVKGLANQFNPLGSLFGSHKKKTDDLKVSTDALNDAEAAGVDVTDKMSTSDVEAATQEKVLADAAHAAGDALEKRWDETNKLLDAQAGAIDSDLAFRNAESSLSDANQSVADKAKAAADAIKQHGANSVEAKAATADLTKAQQDAVGAVVADAEAFVKLKDDQAAANGQTLDAEQKHQILIQRLSDLAAALGPNSPLRAQLQGYIDQLKAVPAKVQTDVQTTFSTGSAAGGQVKRFAGGGDPPGGEAVLVGEEGPELAEFPAGTHITPAGRTRALLSGAGRRDGINVTVHAVHHWQVGVLDTSVVPLIDARIEAATNQIVRALATATA